MGRAAPDGDSETRSSDLPASYRNPWEALAEDLRAVVADSRLRLRAFWRRNGEGDLWRPAWWPGDLAPLFWPLVLGGVMALLSGLVVVLLALLPAGALRDAGGQPTAVQQDSGAVGQESARASTADGDAAAAQGRVAEVSADDVSTDEVSTEDVSTTPEPTSRADADADRKADAAVADRKPDAAVSVEPDAAVSVESDAAVVGDESGSEQSPPAVDPLNALLERPEAVGLVEAALSEPEAGTLIFQLSPAFERLPDGDRRRRAVLWQRWALELGYDHLELRDQGSGLRGRDALVGDGMILFSPQSPA